MGQRIPGSTGGTQDYSAIDPGTNLVNRSPNPGPQCVTQDPNILQRTGYIIQAWEVSKSRFVGPAIIEHTERDFYELVKGAIPMLLAACGLILSTTILGALIGSLAGGIGSLPGAALGFSVGTALLQVLGLAFLFVFLKDRLGDIASALSSGASMAWKSCGSPASIDAAARQMAEGVGLFYAALLQAILLYLGSALASRTLASSRNALRESKLFKSCEKLEAWINRNFAELYQKHIGKPAPGILPPISQSLDEWTAYIQAMKLEPPPANKGMLWSRIGADRAKTEAGKRGLVTLEMQLEKNGFLQAYAEVFGQSVRAATEATTRQIWKMLSEKYASTLRGSVIALVDDASLAKAIRESPVKPIKDLKPGEPAIIKAPQLTNELMEISSVMEKNPNISAVMVRDISNPDVTIKMMTREIVLQSKAAPLH